MSKGEFILVGKCEQLIAKYGSGYFIEISCNQVLNDNIEKIKQKIFEELTELILIQEQETMLQYKVIFLS